MFSFTELDYKGDNLVECKHWVCSRVKFVFAPDLKYTKFDELNDVKQPLSKNLFLITDQHVYLSIAPLSYLNHTD